MKYPHFSIFVEINQLEVEVSSFYLFITRILLIRFAIKSMFCPKESDYVCVLREVRFLRAHRHPCIIDVVDAFVISNPRLGHG